MADNTARKRPAHEPAVHAIPTDVADPTRQALADLSYPTFAAMLEEEGHSRYRAEQVWRWAFKQRVQNFDDMRNVNKVLRQRLASKFSLSRPTIDAFERSADGTRKYRFVAADHTAFESVYIPEVAKGRGTNTLCISSQTGCSVGCKFCFTASLRRNRNLTTAEIIGQVLSVQDDLRPLGEGSSVTNIVFMGMGEPLLNYDNVVLAVKTLLDPNGCDFSSRRVTISTSGIVPNLERLGHDVPTQLAISLNATTDDVRTRIMPINKKWPIARLLQAMRAYPLKPSRRITVEYVLLGDVNDTPEDARRLVKLLTGIPVKLNLLPLNVHERTELKAPTAKAVAQFQRIVLDAGYVAFVRTPRGQDIAAACGQLGESNGPLPTKRAKGLPVLA